MPGTLKYTALLFAACLALAGEAHAGDQGPALYWSIDGADGRVGYLLGTIHSEDPRVLGFGEEFQQQLASCRVFAMELVPDYPNLARLQETMVLPEGQNLSMLLGETRFNAVTAALGQMGISPAQAQRLKPWAAMISLSIPRPKTGQFMDYALSLRASGHGLEVVGLETVDQQLAFLEQLEPEGQIELLDHAVAEFAQVEQVHSRMVDSYLQNDLDALWEEALQQMQPLQADTRDYFLDRGIEARNLGMLASIRPLLGNGPVFIAVGALHLAGRQGLVELLRAEGYTLGPQPLPFAPGADEPAKPERKKREVTASAIAANSSSAPQAGSTHTTARPGTAQTRLAASGSGPV